MDTLHSGPIKDEKEYLEGFVHLAEDSEGSLITEGCWADIDINYKEGVLWDEK